MQVLHFPRVCACIHTIALITPLYTMADVIAIIVADVITTCYLVYYLADVIAICVWQML